MMSSGINALIVSKSKGNVVEIQMKRINSNSYIYIYLQACHNMLPPSVIFVYTSNYIIPYVLLLSLVQFISILWHCISMAMKSRWEFYIMLKLYFVFALKVNIFKGITLPDAPKFGKVFGGQLLGQVEFRIVFFRIL